VSLKAEEPVHQLLQAVVSFASEVREKGENGEKEVKELNNKIFCIRITL